MGVEGNANLFLLNPNGILFGRNASLDLRGSFLATTANSIQFPNNIQFSATQPQPVPLLTINVPIGLQFGHNPGSIVDRSAAQLFELDVPLNDPGGYPATGLRVLPAQTLALVGGDIKLQGGGLVAGSAGSQPTVQGGRIELGSVTGSGLVHLTPVAQGWSLDYRGISTFGEIHLSQSSSVNASGSSGGAIRVQADRISLSEGSGIFSVTQGQEAGGALTLKASDQIMLTNQAFILTETRGAGSAGNIRVTTPRLIIRGDLTSLGSSTYSPTSLGSDTFSDGRGGDVTITAPDTVVINAGLLFAQTCQEKTTCGKGSSGNLTLTTDRLLIQAGGQLNTRTFGRGQGGDMFVQAQTVNLDGIGRDVNGRPILDKNFPFPSGLYTSTAGRSGNGGDLTVETQRLSLSEGAVLYTGTLGGGNAGRLTIRDADSVEISGGAFDANAPTSLGASSGGLGEGFPSEPSAQGAGNTISIETGELTVRDGGRIVVSSINQNAPGAGRIIIDAPLIRLSNGTLSAQTASGDGASIQLRDTDLLFMQNHSRITTDAGLNGGEGTGGDIDINARFAITGEYEDSDITANAKRQDAGNVTVNANTTGFSIGGRLTSYSDITAFSEQGINGTITISNPQVNPTQGLIALPTSLLDRSNQIARGCSSRNADSSRFVATGRGGLPLSPDQPLQDRSLLSPEWVSLDSITGDRATTSPQSQTERSPENLIVEANGFSRDANGKTILIARSHSTDSIGLQPRCDRP